MEEDAQGTAVAVAKGVDRVELAVEVGGPDREAVEGKALEVLLCGKEGEHAASSVSTNEESP